MASTGGGEPAPEANGLLPTYGIGQGVIIVIGAGIGAEPDDGEGCERRSARKQIHTGDTGFERDASGLEGRRGAADHGDGFAAKGRESDILRGMRIIPRLEV